MKKTICLIALLASAMLFYNCGGKTQTEQPQAEEQSADEAPVAEVAYVCPMHPEVTGKKGDKMFQVRHGPGGSERRNRRLIGCTRPRSSLRIAFRERHYSCVW
ncbi:MAG: hypothetical protein HC859_10705 [Bacteroidia bacterium]|nr:hypothetical protein [Bacteroidia bacterium]